MTRPVDAGLSEAARESIARAWDFLRARVGHNPDAYGGMLDNSRRQGEKKVWSSCPVFFVEVVAGKKLKMAGEKVL